MESSLLESLQTNPSKFTKAGLGYELLNEYFDGLSINSLIPLLKSENEDIKREAIWITSELGKNACKELIEHIMPLLYSDDFKTKYFAMECVLLGAIENNIHLFNTIIDLLKDHDSLIRVHAMSLISKTDIEQLESALLAENEPVKSMIERLISPPNTGIIIRMIEGEDELVRKIGTILLGRDLNANKVHLKSLLSSQDEDLRLFAEELLYVNSEEE